MTKRSEKRLKLKKKEITQDTPVQEVQVHKPSSDSPKTKNPILNFYYSNYKILLIIPILLFVLALAQISYQMSTNDGDFINKDISLKGGITITIPIESTVDIVDMQSFLETKGYYTNVRNLQSGGSTIAFLVESEIDLNDQEMIDGLISAISERVPLVEGEYSIEGIGASIGNSFFKQAIISLLISFILMAIIVALTFRSFVPSIAVIAAALSDIVVTIAIVNIIGMKISTAGLAAFLMLIGYSVDTDILLTTRVLKRKEGTVFTRIGSAFKTGILMNFTTIVAIIVALFVTSSDVIRQIMTILLIGILVDQVNTWIQNVGILRLYLEKKKKGAQNES